MMLISEGMETEIVNIIKGTYSTEEQIRTQAEEALTRLDQGNGFRSICSTKFGIKTSWLFMWIQTLDFGHFR